MNPIHSLCVAAALGPALSAQAPAVLLRDLRGGATSSTILGFAEMQGRLFFSARQSATFAANELFATDGTPAGTVSLTQPAAVDVYNGAPVAVGPTLFFLGRTAAQGQELWKSDGTAAGTVRVTDLNAGSMDAFADLLTAWRGECWFTAIVPLGSNYGLWHSDGTAAGTAQQWVNSVRLRSLKVAGDKLYFVTATTASGDELWVLDQPTGTPRLVLDINPGAASSNIGELTEWRGKLWFNADDGVHGSELWCSDGTTAGTVMLVDLAPGGGSTRPGVFTPTRNHLFFMNTDPGSFTYLWQTDGTAAGTQLVPNNPPLVSSAGPSAITSVGDFVYARAATQVASTTIDLWRSDGTAAGTQRVRGADPNRALVPLHLRGVGSRYVYFQGDDGLTGTELWRSDGTQLGTTRVADVNPGSAGSAPYLLQALGGQLVFLAGTPATGTEPFAVPLDAHGQQVGSACGAPARATSLTATDPALGQVCTLSGSNTYPNSTGILFYGPPSPAPLALGSGPCRWNLMPTRFFFLATAGTAAGRWTLALPIPNDPALHRVLLRVQGVFAPTDAPDGIDITNPANLNLGR